MVKSEVASAKEKKYIEATKAYGASDKHILWNHIFPEALSAAVSSTIYAAIMILSIQSSLDFFGFRYDLEYY